MFQNLLENAIAYSGDERPTVEISARRTDGYWAISIADESVSIGPNYQNRVFEIFERVHGRETYDGTGIALALCERIDERHGGEIWVDSEPGEGTTVSVTLPVVETTET